MVKEKRVLIVDDDPNILGMIEEMLPPSMQVYKAESEELALLLLQEHDLDAVLCDISLGRGNGLKLLEKCRARHITVPFVMITGDVTKEKALHAFRLGATDVIEKPIPIDYFETQFIRVIEEGYSIRRIKDGMGQVSGLIGKSNKNGDIDFVKEYLAMVEANRLMKKAG